ncbi:MAG: hypothetical protein ICV51_07645 [Flavisolibacter sp.]|nr:hypothetical protein [Flavisolibacter sp.]
MSTLVVALIVVLAIAAVMFLLVWLHHRQNKKRTEEMLRHFSELGSEYSLSFTGQEVFRNGIIGVDGIKGKLLFLENDSTDNKHWHLINLKEAKSCRVRKLYVTAGIGDPAAKNTETYLHAIILEFDFKSSDRTVALPFYKHISHSIQAAPELEAKAKNWASVLSKMIIKEVRSA